MNHQIFTIYTLGILDNGLANNTNSFLIINNWNDFLRNNIINMIPERYHINFIHCDILETPKQKNRLKPNTNQKIIELTSKMYYLLCDDDVRSSNRITNSTFTVLPLDFEEIRRNRNYLIIDMAGVFTERHNRENFLKGYISKPIFTKIINNPNGHIQRIPIKYKYLNVVNLPYINNNQNSNYNLSNSDLAKTRFFKVLNNGNVITYEQRLIQINYTRRNRIDKIIYICKQICDQVLRNKKISVIENSTIKNELRENKLQIIRLIINNLMNTNIKTYEQLFNQSINDIETIFIPY